MGGGGEGGTVGWWMEERDGNSFGNSSSGYIKLVTDYFVIFSGLAITKASNIELIFSLPSVLISQEWTVVTSTFKFDLNICKYSEMMNLCLCVCV